MTDGLAFFFGGMLFSDTNILINVFFGSSCSIDQRLFHWASLPFLPVIGKHGIALNINSSVNVYRMLRCYLPWKNPCDRYGVAGHVSVRLFLYNCVGTDVLIGSRIWQYSLSSLAQEPSFVAVMSFSGYDKHNHCIFVYFVYQSILLIHLS